MGAQAVRFLVQLGSTAVLARILAPDDFGFFAMTVTVIGLANLFVDVGFSTATIQVKDLSAQQRTNFFWLSIATGAVVAGLIVLSAPAVADLYNTPALVDLLHIAAVTLVVQAASTQFSVELARLLNFRSLALIDIAAVTTAALAAIVCALSGVGAASLVIQPLVAAGVTLIVLVLSAKWFPGIPRSAPMRGMLAFGLNTFALQLVNYFSANVGSIVLGRYWGATTLGFYDRAYQLFRAPVQQMLTPLTRVALPVLSKLQSEPAAFDRAVRRIHLAIVYVTGAVFLLGAGAASPIVAILLGPQWTQTALLFAILAIGGFFQTMGYIYYWTFLAKAMTGLQLRYALITRSLMVVLVVLGALWGSVGVAAAVAVGLALDWVILTLLPMRRTGVDVAALVKSSVRPILIHIAAALVVLAVVTATPGWPPIVQLAVGGVAALGVYGVVGVLFGSVRGDYAILWGLASRIRRG